MRADQDADREVGEQRRQRQQPEDDDAEHDGSKQDQVTSSPEAMA